MATVEARPCLGSQRPTAHWTGEMRERFQDAVAALDAANHKVTAKSILKHMKVPGLTLKQVQNYLARCKLALKEGHANGSRQHEL